MISREAIENAVETYDPNIQINLQDHSLWQSFYHCNNEMIINREGRKMFPVINITATGLQKNDLYVVLLQFKQVTKQRWKFSGNEWSVSGCSDNPKDLKQKNFYCHQSSPGYGEYWMKQSISFGQVRLTNQQATTTNQVEVNSLHKYVPVVKIFILRSLQSVELVFQQPIQVCQFIAVTAYQNDELTALKVKHNPFAKSVSECREKKRKSAFAESQGHFHQMREAIKPYNYNLYNGMLMGPYYNPNYKVLPYNSSVPVIGANALPATFRSTANSNHLKQISDMSTAQNQYEEASNWRNVFQPNSHQQILRHPIYQPYHYNYSLNFPEPEIPQNSPSAHKNDQPLSSTFHGGIESQHHSHFQYQPYPSNPCQFLKSQFFSGKSAESEFSLPDAFPLYKKPMKMEEQKLGSNLNRSFSSDSGYSGSYAESVEGISTTNSELGGYSNLSSLNYPLCAHNSMQMHQNNGSYFLSNCDYAGYHYDGI